MNSSRPYLLRAIYEWLIDNQLTPHIKVNALLPQVKVPKRFIEDGQIILNLEPQAVGNLRLGNDAVEFDARFSGVAHHVFIPIRAVRAVYACENGHGMVFGEDDDDGGDDGGGASSDDVTPLTKKSRPKLRVVK